MAEAAEKVQDWLRNATQIDYEHVQIEIEDIDTGCKKKRMKINPWLKRK